MAIQCENHQINEASTEECAGFGDFALASNPRTVHAATVASIGYYGWENLGQRGRLFPTVAFPSDLRELTNLRSHRGDGMADVL